ncbi:unnamed protein product [Lactuca virosa]|uniref:Uncharacterized protein n=1 Tax=Lactuca virosa TaxID=75947 RepID=A0AAU9PVS2_9ASTR|nr:unnamed protein product [Lactuca virosa]
MITPVETETEINIFKQPNIPTPEQIEALIKELLSTTRKPPQAVPVTVESPSESDKDKPNASLVPKKRRHNQGPTVEPAQVHQGIQIPTFDDDLNFVTNEETFASWSSSAPPPPEHDAASVKFAKLLAFQDFIPQSKGKGISIGSWHGGDEDSQKTISELKQEIVHLKQESIEKDLLIGSLDVRVSELEKENSQKNKQVSGLQANLGGLTARYYDV